MESRKIAAGFPCCKYILYNTKTEDDLWLYAKTFLNTAAEHGMNYDDSISMLLASLSTYSFEDFKCPDFLSMGESPEEVFDVIVSHPTEIPYKSCVTLYRRIERNIYACKLCRYNSERYLNNDEATEWALIKYLLKSDECATRVFDYFTSEYFKSVIDVSYGIPCVKSQVVPVAKELFISASKDNLRLIMFDESGQIGALTNCKTPFDFIWADAFASFPSKRKLAHSLRHNPNWENVVKSEVTNLISSAHDFTDEEILDLIDSVIKGGKRPTISWEDSTPLFDMVKSDEQQASEKPGVVDDGDGSIESPIDSTPAATPEENAVKNTGPNTAAPLNSDIAGSEYFIKLSDDLIIKDASLPTKLKDMLVDVSVEVPQSFFQGTLTDKQLPVEVVIDKNGKKYLLIYSRHLKKFLYCCTATIPDAVRALLSGQKVEKLCHTPYLLMSECRLHGVEIKNVISLLTMFSSIIPETGKLTYMSFIDNFSIKKDIYEVSEDLLLSCPFLKGLQLYRAIKRIIQDKVDASDNIPDIYTNLFLDEALGFSYFYSHNFEDSGLSFIMPLPNKFVFKKEYVRTKKTEGRYISYSSENGVDAHTLFEYVLSRLAIRGFFRKTRLQLIQSDNECLTLFIDKENEDYLLAIVEMLIFEYGRYNKTGPQQVNCLKYTE